MLRLRHSALFSLLFLVLTSITFGQNPLRLEDLLSAPFPSNLVAGPTGERVAWVFNDHGRRNVWYAEGPEWNARPLTTYSEDDGQVIQDLHISADGKWIVFSRGDESGGNWSGEIPNPTGSIKKPKSSIVTVPVFGGVARELGSGRNIAISPDSNVVAFTSEGQIWTVPTDGHKGAENLIYVRGSSSDLRWAPDGSALTFTIHRGDHSFIGLYHLGETSVHYIAPSTCIDSHAEWSPDGSHLAFVRQPGVGGKPESILSPVPAPWSIQIADVSSEASSTLWKSPKTPWNTLPTSGDGPSLAWLDDNHVQFKTDTDKWSHLYRAALVGEPASLYTPGAYMCEDVTVAPNRFTVFSANWGPFKEDQDRRHLFRLEDRKVVQVTSGKGIECHPVVTGDGLQVAYLQGGAQQPMWPAVVPIAGGRPQLLALDQFPHAFPTSSILTPKQVLFRSGNATIHGQVFRSELGPKKRAAVIFVHGGPRRQMLLGWHYMDYYSHDYAVNQALASRGVVVLSVNYRLGIGYGRDFEDPRDGGWGIGLAEYEDVKAAAAYLRSLPDVDPRRIAIYGGSYGGYLTAQALARDSNIFCCGVDIHGVHDMSGSLETDPEKQLSRGESSDFSEAVKRIWLNSPDSQVANWRSPVLFIHGDDDRNVHFSEMIDIVNRLSDQSVSVDQMVIPDEIHGFLLHKTVLRVETAVLDFFVHHLRERTK